jgi:hypothetical protein
MSIKGEDMQRLKILGMLLCLFVSTYPYRVFADTPFYDGEIVIESVEASVNIEGEAIVEIDYLLMNRGEGEVTINLDFLMPDPEVLIDGEEWTNPVVFDPGEVKSLVVSAVLEPQGEDTKSLAVPTNLFLDGKLHAERSKLWMIQMTLPEGVHGIILASKEPTAQGAKEDGRVTYTWEYVNIYPTTLDLKWSVLDLDLDLEKRISPEKITEPDQILTIEIQIKNAGEEKIENILLLDDFVPADFEPVEPQQEFFIPETTESDPRLFWVKEVLRLEAGEERSFQYKVKYTGDISVIHDLEIKPCRVMVEGRLVDVSNLVRINKLVGAGLEAEAQEDLEKPAPFPLWGICTLALGGTALGGFLIYRGFLLARRGKGRYPPA